MNRRTSFFALIGAVTVIGAGAAFTTQDGAADAVKAKIGEPAPAFSLEGTDGETHSLKDYEGKIVVLQWINPQCPVCDRCMSDGTVTSMSKNLKELDKEIVHLAINSSHFATLEDSKKYVKESGLKIVALDDSDGKVGKLYGAKTTPHLMVVDAEGVFRYTGAIDNGGGNRKGDTNYVVNAVQQILAGETVAPSETRPYGCSVKFARN